MIFQSIRWRLQLWYGLVFLALLAGFGFTAYALLRQAKPAPKRVLMLGPCHRVPLRGMALSTAEAWDGPLGRMALDRPGALKLKDQGLAQWSDLAHAAEHSLEVQMPFLSAVAPQALVLPVLVGRAPAEDVAALINAAMDPETLMKTWVPAGMSNLEQMQRMFWQQFGGVIGNSGALRWKWRNKGQLRTPQGRHIVF